MPSNQRQIKEQSKIAYSPSAKAFEKQTKTIEYQGQKQIEAIEDNKKQLDNIDNKKQLGNNELLFSKERKKFKNIYNKRIDKVNELSKKLDYGDFKFIVNSSSLETNFSELKDPVASIDSIKNVKY